MTNPEQSLRRVLWFDAAAGSTAGLAMAALVPQLAPLFGSTPRLLYAVAIVNLAYGLFAFSVARMRVLVPGRVRALALANAAWTVVCVGLVASQWNDATWLGLLWFAGEGVFVGVLSQVELRALARALRPPAPR